MEGRIERHETWEEWLVETKEKITLQNENMEASLKVEQKRTDAMRKVINRFTEGLPEESVQLLKGNENNFFEQYVQCY